MPRRAARRLHGDPHPGNSRLLPDRRLAVLDPGATEALPHRRPARLGPLLAAGRDGDAAAVHRIAASAGLSLDATVSLDAEPRRRLPGYDPSQDPGTRS